MGVRRYFHRYGRIKAVQMKEIIQTIIVQFEYMSSGQMDDGNAQDKVLLRMH